MEAGALDLEQSRFRWSQREHHPRSGVKDTGAQFIERTETATALTTSPGQVRESRGNAVRSCGRPRSRQSRGQSTVDLRFVTAMDAHSRCSQPRESRREVAPKEQMDQGQLSPRHVDVNESAEHFGTSPPLVASRPVMSRRTGTARPLGVACVSPPATAFASSAPTARRWSTWAMAADNVSSRVDPALPNPWYRLAPRPGDVLVTNRRPILGWSRTRRRVSTTR